MKKNYKKHLNKIAVLALTMVLCLSNMGPSFAYIGELSGNPEKTEKTEKFELYAEGEAIVCCVDYSNVDGQALKNEIKLIENELDEPKTEETDLSDLNALLKNSEELMDLGKKPVKQFESIDKGILNIKSKSAGKASKILKHVVNEDMTTEELVEKLEELPNVEYAEPNYYKVPMADTTYYDWQWAYNGESNYGLNVPNWNVSGNANAEGVVVAVMDSGVNYNNPDLKYIMWDEGENYPTLTALGGGKYGINTAGTTVAAKKDPMDNHSHGTHCSGIIGAQWNSYGVSGAANGVEIMGVKAGDASMSTTDIIKGFAYIKAAKEAGVNVVAVNNSWGGGAPGGEPTSTCNAITSLNEVGVVCVFAAGNENSDIDIYYEDYPYDSPIGLIPMDGYWDAYYYHDLPNTIIVGSNGMSGNRASYSNWGKNKVDVFAPGGDYEDYIGPYNGEYLNGKAAFYGEILSTVSKGTSSYPNTDYGTMQGTSMACPAVTGAVAILRAQYPEATAGAIIEAVKDGVTEGKTDIKQKCDAEGYVNVEKSLEILAATYSASEDAKPFASITSTNDGFEDQTVTLIASAEAGIAAYYWGTDASGDPQETGGISTDGTLNTTKVVSADGKYYLIAKDASGNSVSENITFYKTSFNTPHATVSPAYVIVEAGKSHNLPVYTAISADAGYFFAQTSNLSLWKKQGSYTATNGGASITPSSSTTYNLNKACNKTVAKPTSPADVPYTGSAQTIGIDTPDGVTASGTTTATNLGTYTAKYTPKSGYCWEDGTTTTVSVQWKIVKGQNTITAPADQTWSPSYKTSAQTKSLTEFSNAKGTVTYSISGDAQGFSISGTTLTMPANKPVGTYTLTIKGVAAGTPNYASGDATFNVTVNVIKAANRITAPADQTWNATFSSDAQTKEITEFSNADGDVIYSISGDAQGFSINDKTLTMPANKGVGTYTLKIQGLASGDANHNSGTSTLKVIVKIAKAVNRITAPADQTWNPTFSSDAQTKSLNGFISADGTVTYSISGEANGFTISGTTLTMPAKKAVGTYTLTIKGEAAGTDNYNSKTSTFKVTVTVAKLSIAKPSADARTFTYNGSVQTYTPLGFDSATMDISGNAQTNAGTYTVEVTPKSNYTWSGSCSFTWTIQKAEQAITAADPQSFAITTSENSVIASAEGTLHYSVVSGDSVSVDSETGALTISSIGNTVIKISADATENYNAASKNITVIIATATSQVTFEKNGGICDSLPRTYAEGMETTLPTDITREGYEFAGWYRNSECSGEAATKILSSDSGTLKFWAKWIAKTYTITNETPQAQAASSNGYIEVSSEASCGSAVIVTVHANSGYKLDTIKYTESGVSQNITNSGGVYKFTMPAGNVTVKATFKEETTGGGGGSGGGGGDAPSEPGATNPTINIGTETGNIDVTVEDGVAKVGEISKSDLESAAKDSGKTDSTAIVIDLSQSGNVDSVELTTTTVINILGILKSNKYSFNTFEIQLIDATLSFNAKAVDSVKKQAKGKTIDFAVVKISTSSLNNAQKKTLMKKEVGIVFNAEIESAGKVIHSFNGGKAYVGIKYTTPADKQAENAKAYYIDSKGKMTKLATKCADGSLMFATPHFSDFAVVFDQKPESVSLKAKTSGKRAIKLSWNAVGGAEKYVVYGAKKGKTLKKIKTVKGKSYKVTKASGSKLKSRSTYKFYVVAYDALGQKFKSKTISKKAR